MMPCPRTVPSVVGLDLDLDLDREPRGRDRKRGNCSADIARHVMPYEKNKIHRRLRIRNKDIQENHIEEHPSKELATRKEGDISYMIVARIA